MMEMPWRLVSWRGQVFSYEDKKDQVKIAALRRNLEERAGWTREDLKLYANAIVQ